MRFPDDFWWGTGASSTQSEGAAPASDWFREEQRGTYPRSGDGNAFGTRYAEDFALYAEHGLRHHRLSIEWSRTKPRWRACRSSSSTSSSADTLPGAPRSSSPWATAA